MSKIFKKMEKAGKHFPSEQGIQSSQEMFKDTKTKHSYTACLRSSKKVIRGRIFRRLTAVSNSLNVI
jgi:hypothetical protein